MHKKYLITITILISLFASSGFAQGEFLRKGENGLGVSPRVTFSQEGEQTFGFSMGFSYKGRLDIGLGYTNYPDGELESFGSRMTFHAIKRQFSSATIGLALMASVERIGKIGRWKKSVFGGGLGVGLYTNFYFSDQNVIHIYGTASSVFELEDLFDESVAVGSLGLTLGFSQKMQFRPFVGASIHFIGRSSDYPYGAVTAGFVIAF